MVKKLLKCPNCGKISSQWVDQEKHPSFKKMETILKSKKTPHEKKLALFNCLKSMDVGKIQPLEEQRLNSLLLSKLYNELARKSLKEYRELTVKDYSEKSEGVKKK